MQRLRISINTVIEKLITAKGYYSKTIKRLAESVWEIIQRGDW